MSGKSARFNINLKNRFTILGRRKAWQFVLKYKKVPHPKRTRNRGTTFISWKTAHFGHIKQACSIVSRVTMRPGRQSLLQNGFGLEAQKSIHLSDTPVCTCHWLSWVKKTNYYSSSLPDSKFIIVIHHSGVFLICQVVIDKILKILFQTCCHVLF